MQFSTIILSLAVALFLILVFQVEEAVSLYPYAIRGFVTDVRRHPTRFVGLFFFTKALKLKALKLKWKLKKKFILKKLLKKLFIARAIAIQGRKRRSVRFPDEENGNHFSPNGPTSSISSSSSTNPLSSSFGSSSPYSHHHHSSGSSSSSSPRAFFDEEEFNEFQSIGLGQQELEMLRQLPQNLQYEYKQEMEELDTSASEPRETDIMEYLTATNEFDTDHCIAKGICEVMSRGNNTSNRFERLLLDYYNEEPAIRKNVSENDTPAYIYDYAAFLGKSRRGDERACASYFPKCPEPTQQITSFMNEISSTEMCDPPVHNEL